MLGLMNTSSFLLKQLKEHRGNLEVQPVVQQVINRLNKPYFDSGGGADAVQVVQNCWLEFERVPMYGPAPKSYLHQLIRLGDRWHHLGTSDIGTEAQRALFRYNSALLHSVVVEALQGSTEG